MTMMTMTTMTMTTTADITDGKPMTTLHSRFRVAGRGYSLPFVMLILILLSISLASLLFVLTSGARSTESMLGRRRLFYACDGLSRIAAVSAQNYFTQTTAPTSEALRDFVCLEGGGCDTPMLTGFMSQTPGHTVTNFELSQVNARRSAPLDSGPFEGMMAMQDSVEMTVEIEKNSSGWKCNVKQELALAKISMFQFFLFSDQPYTDWIPGPPMAGDGRVHVNGILCFHSIYPIPSGGLWVSRITAAGRLSPGESGPGACRSPSFSDGPVASRPQIAIVTDPVFDTTPGNDTPVEPETAHFKSFAVRGNNVAAWRTEAATFNGRLLDEAHNVVPLRLPVQGAPAVQRGADADLAAMDNTTTRLLIDPMKIDNTEESDVRAQRFAFKADIRIINGVWYLRDRASPQLAGTVIWSDHPGDVTLAADQGIVAEIPGGQQNIFASGPRPTRYSYYRFDSSNELVTTSLSPAAVVSYGTLKRDEAAHPLWLPASWCGGANLTAVDTPCASQSFGERLLAGTRSGFRDGHAAKVISGRGANILPMNFDVGALQNALGDCTNSELGSHFPGTCNDLDDTGAESTRRFNGIVYITNTWPKSAATTPSAVPAQGARGATTAVAATKTQAVAPEPLCAQTAKSVSTSGFPLQACADYAASPIVDEAAVPGARATAVRVINARNMNVESAATAGRPALVRAGLLDNGVGQRGLTIATNLPIYILGDANMSSVPGGDPWVPMLVTGDVLSILSNKWKDDDAAWDNSLGTARNGKETTIHSAILSGWTPTTSTNYSGGIHNFTRFLEDWAGKPLHIRGSIVVGWSAVYARWRAFCCGPDTYNPPLRDWGYDTNLDDILNQPPGAPLFDVQSTRRWTR